MAPNVNSYTDVGMSASQPPVTTEEKNQKEDRDQFLNDAKEEQEKVICQRSICSVDIFSFSNG